MLARSDSSGPSGLSTASAPPFPAWARALHPPETEAEAAFLAGAALARLDQIVRENPPWAGVCRQRLALAAATASVARAGRNEDEPALRDALHLGRPGADPGPAGRRLLAWRALAAGSTGQWRSAIAVAAERLQIPSDEALQAAIASAEACVASSRLAPFAAARAHELARRALTPAAGRVGAGESELLAAWLADSVLAQKLKWPFARPRAGARRPTATAPKRPASCSPGRRGPRTPAISPPSCGGGRKNWPRRRRNCARRAPEPRCRRCSTRIRSPPRPRSPASPSAGREGCSNGSPRSARSAN